MGSHGRDSQKAGGEGARKREGEEGGERGRRGGEDPGQMLLLEVGGLHIS